MSTVHKIAFPIVRPMPFRTTQLRSWEVVTANTWDATTSLQLRIYRDATNTADSVGTAITSAAVHIKNPTVGSSDTAERWIPELVLTTNGSYLPLTFDPWILGMKLVFRTPQITRYTIPLDNKTLAETDPRLNGRVVQKALQGLMNQGPVTVSPPDPYGTGMVYDTNNSAEVVRADERRVRGKRVLDVYLQKFVQD